MPRMHPYLYGNCFHCGNRFIHDNDAAVYETCRLTDGEPCNPCKRVVQLNAKIRDAYKEIEELMDERRRLKEQVNNSHDPIVHRLPLELSSTIFELCVAESHHMEDKHDSVTPYQYLLGAACRKWQAVALSTPQLWNYITIYRQSRTQFSDIQFHRALQCIIRSGQLPLTIKIQQLYFDECCVLFLDALNQCSNRWYDLDISCDPSYLTGDGSQNFPLILRTLTLSGQRGNKFQMKNSIRLPAPTYVFLYNFGFADVQINWRHVTNFQSYSLFPSEFVELLRRAPMLADCSVELTATPNIPQPLIIHDNLATLKVGEIHRFISLPGSSSFESYTCFPNLKELTVNKCFYPDLLTSFFSRSSCPLRYLEINYPATINDHILIPLLKEVPSLEVLKINALSWSPSALNFFLSAVFADDEDGVFLPCLRELTLERLEIGTPLYLIPNMANYQPSLIQPLRKVNLHYENCKVFPDNIRLLREKDISVIRGLIDMGIEMIITSTYEAEQRMDFLTASIEYPEEG